MSRVGSDSGDERDAAAVAVGTGDQFVGGLERVHPSSRPRSSRRRAGSSAVRRCLWRRVCGFQIGPAAAKMTSAAASRRSAVSHHGVRDGVSSLRCDVEQQARRRKVDAARPRRHHAQQPPQHRQREQARSAAAARQRRAAGPSCRPRPALTVVVAALPPVHHHAACRNSNSSAAERSVVWVENRPVELAGSMRISSRCARARAI